MVNTKCDTSYYDSRGYQRKIFMEMFFTKVKLKQ